MNPTIEGELVEDQALTEHLEHVENYGFPLGILGRVLCALKAIAYLAGAALVAFPAKLLFSSSIELEGTFHYVGALVMFFDIAVWLVVMYFTVMALLNILIALSGRMTIEARAANESAERL